MHSSLNLAVFSIPGAGLGDLVEYNVLWHLVSCIKLSKT